MLRTLDDCVVIYGNRWDNKGDSRDIKVRNVVIRRMYWDGKEVRSLEEGNIRVGDFAEGIVVVTV